MFKNVLVGVDGRPTGCDAIALAAGLTDPEGKLTLAHVHGEELAAFGEEVDILVVGSRSYGPVRRLVLGSTSTYLERHARCSLLVLPRSTAAAAAPAATTAAAATTTAAGIEP
jgi:hypothetical protein